MEVLERGLNVMRCLCWRMKEEEENFCGYRVLEVVHGRAIWWHGPCQPSGVWRWVAWLVSTAVPVAAQAVPSLWTGDFKKFHFLQSYSTITGKTT
jgi:hypothetical protein